MQAELSSVEKDRFTDLVTPCLLPMSRLAGRLAPHGEPEDIVQDALATAWSRRDQFDPERGTPLAWLLSITASLALATTRTRSRRTALDALHPREPHTTPAADDLVDVDLDRAIDRLSDRRRLAVVCHYFVGLTVEETAAVMHCSPGTVKATLSDARRHLRTLLGDTND